MQPKCHLSDIYAQTFLCKNLFKRSCWHALLPGSLALYLEMIPLISKKLSRQLQHLLRM